MIESRRIDAEQTLQVQPIWKMTSGNSNTLPRLSQAVVPSIITKILLNLRSHDERQSHTKIPGCVGSVNESEIAIFASLLYGVIEERQKR